MLALAVAVLAVGLVQGCGDPAPPTLSAADVANIPPGTLTGNFFSGTYAITTASLDGCHCRVGSCSMFTAQPKGELSVAQQGGAMTVMFRDPNGSATTGELSGGINADSSFKVGEAAMNVNQGIFQISHAYNLMIGTFLPVTNGHPVELRAEFETTILGRVLIQAVDCDLEANMVAQLKPTP